jgi:hypothetical protein
MSDLTVIEYKPTTKEFQIRPLSESVDINFHDLVNNIPLLWVPVAICSNSEIAFNQLTNLLKDRPELGS